MQLREPGHEIQIAAIVVGQGPEEIGLHRLRGVEHLAAVILQRNQRAFFDLGREAVAAHGNVRAAVPELQLAHGGAAGGRRHFPQEDLAEILLKPGARPRFIVDKHERHGEDHFAGGIRGQRNRERDRFGALGREHQPFADAGLHLFAVDGQAPADLVIRRGNKAMLVAHGDPAVRRVRIHRVQIRIAFFDFIIRGLGLPIGGNDAVRAEIIARAALVEVAAVEPFFLPVLDPADRLIHIVPDEAAGHVRPGLEILHVFAEIAQAVFHRVGIFAIDHRVIRIHPRGHGLVVRRKGVRDVVIQRRRHRLLQAQLLHHRLGRIHPADEIALGKVEIALVMDRAGSVQRKDRLAFMHEILAVAGFIAQRPEADAGVAAVAQHHAAGAVLHRGAELRIVARAVFAAHAVAFDIRLVHHIETQLVAQLIEQLRIRIMARADRVDIRAFHQI